MCNRDREKMFMFYCKAATRAVVYEIVNKHYQWGSHRRDEGVREHSSQSLKYRNGIYTVVEIFLCEQTLRLTTKNIDHVRHL